MQAAPIETDYLVVGTGATAMAFVDTLLDESRASVVMVDRHHRPGGHWNEAYPFVRLHQPSAWYGAASRALPEGRADAAGLHQGASGAEVLAYFDQLMQERFLPSGRVQWFPMCEYGPGADGSHRFRSLTTGEARSVTVRRRLVDATLARTELPSTHPPKYALAPGVDCIAPNRLPELRRPYARYAVVGAGKTGMDACLWLLQNGVPPARIGWVRPRDPWLLDRGHMQPGVEHFERSMGSTIAQFEAIAGAASVPELFARLEARGVLLRIDRSVEPTVFRCAIVSQAELAELRRIGDVVRLGHVRRVEPGQLVLERGSVAADPDTLYIDCSARALQPPPALPVFDNGLIRLLMVSWCRPTFSAAVIACVESRLADDAEKNALCVPVPTPERPTDWLSLWAVTLANTWRWSQHPAVNAWLKQCRLNSTAIMMRGVAPDDAARFALLRESGAKAGAAAARLPGLIGTLGR